MKNKKRKAKVKEIKRAIGRLRTPPSRVMEDEREKLRKKAQGKESKQAEF